jgi:ComF family protein
MACKTRLYRWEKYLCEECLKYRYKDPNPDKHRTCEGILLPDTVYFQEALWKFDSGGTLQELLHHLKYQGLGAVGIRLGEQLGKKLTEHPGFQLWKEKNEIIEVTSVPLHPKKKRIRGYNQAHKIAIGVSRGSDTQLLPYNALSRTRYTETQTHFTHEERIKNMEGVFVADSEHVNGKCMLIADDVFTTGATSYACAKALIKAGAKEVGIVTVAIA